MNDEIRFGFEIEQILASKSTKSIEEQMIIQETHKIEGYFGCTIKLSC